MAESQYTATAPASTPGYDDEARNNWHRYLYIKERGHIEYMAQAQKCEGMYLGAGLQWADEDKAILTAQRRPFYEFNEILPSVNAALGHQIQNRLDISFQPRGGQSDLLKATALSKVVMQVADANKLHWLETQVYADGLIEQRGYFDVRMNFESNIKGEIDLTNLDPRDVMPDPDAKSYDPDQWADVTVTRWLSLDEIEERYGAKARIAAERSGDEGPDWGVADAEIERNKFGTTIMVGGFDAYNMESGVKRYRIVDRQRWVYEKCDCLVYPDSGDVKTADTLSDEEIASALAQGAVKAKRMRRRIRWTVSTYTASLFDDLSPYEHFTIVPYFAYFRRGKTRGMVDNGIGPQEVLNKAISQYIHILNTSANSGWITEENSLANMDEEELEAKGATTGLHLQYKKGSSKPEKITPNQVPPGVAELADRATQALKDVTVPDAMRGVQGGNAISGVAKQADQFASQQQLAVPLDNLAYTRQMLGTRIMKLVQRYYDSYRVFRITETDAATGQEVEKLLEINKPMPDGSYFNDITAGTYDVVVTEAPMAVTFEMNQYQQALEMKKEGVAIPDSVIIRYSSLADKADILAAQQPDPEKDANVELLRAKAQQARSQAQTLDVATIYSAVQAAGAITLNPAISQPADAILGSVGFQDKDAPPVVPMVNGTAAAQLAAPAPLHGQPPVVPNLPSLPAPDNTHPNLPPKPASPAVGMDAGIETPSIQGAPA